MDLKLLFSEGNVNTLLIFLWLLPVLQLITGILRSITKGPNGLPQFDWNLLDVFVYTDLAQRILPLTIGLLLGVFVDVASAHGLVIPFTDLGAVTATASGFTVLYLVHVLASIISNINPATPDTLPTLHH